MFSLFSVFSVYCWPLRTPCSFLRDLPSGAFLLVVHTFARFSQTFSTVLSPIFPFSRFCSRACFPVSGFYAPWCRHPLTGLRPTFLFLPPGFTREPRANNPLVFIRVFPFPVTFSFSLVLFFFLPYCLFLVHRHVFPGRPKLFLRHLLPFFTLQSSHGRFFVFGFCSHPMRRPRGAPFGTKASSYHMFFFFLLWLSSRPNPVGESRLWTRPNSYPHLKTNLILGEGFRLKLRPPPD